VISVLLVIALAGAATVWGVDSRDDPSRSRPRRWFIELDGGDRPRGLRVAAGLRASSGSGPAEPEKRAAAVSGVPATR
jgi:hypothetical protein